MGTGSSFGNISPAAKFIILGFAAIVVVFTAVLLFLSAKPPVCTVSGGTLKISGIYGETVKLSDITGIQLKDSPPANLSKVNGSDFGSRLKGRFSSSSGDVTLFIDTSKPNFIWLDTSKGLIVLNDQTKTGTQALYDKLTQKTGLTGQTAA